MKKTVTITYPASPLAVATMLADPDYQRQRLGRLLARAGQGVAEAEVTGAPTGSFTATLSGQVPRSVLPAAAQRLIRGQLAASLSESWGEPADDGARSGQITVTVTGAPVTLGAATTMSGQGQTTTVTAQVDLAVRVPLLGRSVEERVLALTDRLVADEEKRAAAWLAEHSS